MPEKHFTIVEFNKSFKMKKEYIPEEIYSKETKEELGKALKDWITQSLENISLKEFIDYCCKFTHYYEETKQEGIIKSDRVYY
jgi:RNase P/RNase MRP subunit POP5